MDAIAFVAERKIEQALEEGQFDKLPGMGGPLVIEDLSHMPPELRMAYAILKNSGYIDKLPEAGSFATTRELLESCPDAGQAYGKMQRLKLMFGRIRHAQRETFSSAPADVAESEIADSPYLEKLISRI